MVQLSVIVAFLKVKADEGARGRLMVAYGITVSCLNNLICAGIVKHDSFSAVSAQPCTA